MYATHMLFVGSSRTWQPFVICQHIEHSHCSLEKGTPDYIPSTLTDRSVALHPISLPLTTIKAMKKVKHLLMNKLHQFTRPISPACDQYVQYLLVGVIYWSLTNIDGDCKLIGAGFPHHSPRSSQPMVHCFSLMVSSGLKLTSSTKTSSN
jgi:hypothetical protein